MIIRSRWRRAGGLAAHLVRVDTNESVLLRDDLGRDAPGTVHQAVALFTAISRTNARTVRDLIHIKISPDTELTDVQLAHVIAGIEREHAIPDSVPRLVVQHAKGDRAKHFHLIYPVVDPKTGRAVPSQGNFFRDELISRVAEIEFGQRIVPGPRQNGVVTALYERGLEHEAMLLAAHAPTWVGNRLGDAVRQQTETLAVDARLIMVDAAEMWRQANGDASCFETECAKRGYLVARGDRAHLLVHESTGAYVPLARALRQKAKEAGKPLEVRERDFRDAFPSAPPFGSARETALDNEMSKAKAEIDRELERLQQEAAQDGQTQLGERLRLVRDGEKRARKESLKRSLAARRADIKADVARRDRIRRARVNRAFLVAGITDRPDIREFVFGMAAGTVMLAGGGLGVALVAAGIAVVALPARERARAIALEARLRRNAERDDAARASHQAYDQIAAEHRLAKTTRLDFGAIAKRHRVVAGAYSQLILDRADQRLEPRQGAIASALARLLGDQQARILENTILQGSGRGILTVMSWYDRRQGRHRTALAAALRQAGEMEAAHELAPQRAGKTRPAQGRDR